MNINNQNVRNIVILKWGALGDLVASTSAIKALRDNFPDAHITLLTNHLMEQLLPAGFIVDELVFLHTHGTHVLDSFFRQLQTILNLRRKKFDIAVNLRWTSERSAVMTYLTGAKIRVSSGPKDAWRLYTIPLQHPIGPYHEIHRHLDIVKALGCTVFDETPILCITDQQDKRAQQFFAENNLLKEKTLCLHPGASKPVRAWLPERYAEIGKRLTERYDAKILLTYGKGEEQLVQQVAAMIGKSAIIGQSPTIGDLAALIRHSKLFLSNCTGPMNVAVAARTPVVALLGSSDPIDWGAYGTMHINIKSPIVLPHYTDEQERQAYDAITIERVWETISTRWEALRND
ncbi:MAG TPA: glycosyltransferase family 9 protein [Bacteroidota bacterium]|nr:glycosyltransferase family 9 protein [Bacteroidota bacterium]